MRPFAHFVLSFFLFCMFSGRAAAQQEMDAPYAEKIKEYTTQPAYLNDLVDHLPASSSVPSPLDFFGTIVGAPDTLHYSAQIYAYMRALERASPRVVVRTIGQTEEGRDMIEVLLADTSTIKQLDTYRGYLNQLSDPRTLDQEEASEVLQKAKPIYYLTAGLHSPETGSPEMVMELAYRLAVGESPLVQNIRSHLIVALSPVTEPDGRDRVVDVYRWRSAHEDVTPNLTYWGHYVAHDNNRDGHGLALALTRNILRSYLHWKPTVLHDLHESVPFLYVQTGRGPYNPYFDATTVDEWNKLAYNDVNALTRRDMPGVWTWGFFNGWAGNYLAWIANNRNSVGRFYETFGNSIPQTVERTLSKEATSQEWYRMNPPVEKTTWSLRDNTNYTESAVLSTLDYTATHRREFLQNFYRRSRKAIERGSSEAPYAFVIPKNQRRALATARLINLLRENGIEVQETEGTLAWTERPGGQSEESAEAASTEGRIAVEGGAYIVRMDQPYRTLIGTLLDRQDFPERYDAPYDDVGWTLPYLYQVTSYKVGDPDILEADMQLLTADLKPEGGLSEADAAVFLVNNTTDDAVAQLRLGLADLPMQAAEASFQMGGKNYAAGTLLLSAGDLSGDQRQQFATKVQAMGLKAEGVGAMPDVAMHDLNVPRIALLHTWIPTPQNGGWWRLAFDKLQVPYDYISTQDLATMDPAQYDVLVLPATRADPFALVQGSSQAGPPLPWQKTPLTPNLGRIDETEDQRRGMGYEGLSNLKAFVERGGVLITDATSAEVPIDLGLTRHVRVARTRSLETHGSIFKARVTDEKSPIAYGYPDTLAVYFNRAPVLQADTSVGGEDSYMIPDWLKDQRWAQEYPRIVMRFGEEASDLLLSGMLKGGEELAGTPAVVDAPVGEGHIVLFAHRSFWRWETPASHALVFNTMLHWDDLRTGWPTRPGNKAEKEETDEAEN